MKKLFTFAFLFAFATTVFAQQKNIVDYYNLIKPKLLQEAKKAYNNSAVKIVTRKQDVKNGFISFGIDPAGMGTSTWDMALWIDARGGNIIGLFEFGCGGMGCNGSLKNLRFFDGQMREITADLPCVAQLKNYYRSIIQNKTLGLMGFEVKIPKNGTTIYIQPSAGVHGEALSNNYKSALVYNYSNGQFTFVKK